MAEPLPPYDGEPDPNTESIFNVDRDQGPVISANGPDDYECANCGELLLEGMNPGQVAGVVLVCPNCGEYSDTPMGFV